MSRRYVVRLGDGRTMDFGDALDEAIAYATDARAGGGEVGGAAEVWTAGAGHDLQRRVWPNAGAG